MRCNLYIGRSPPSSTSSALTRGEVHALMFSPDTLVWAEKLLYTYFTPDALPLVHMPHPPLRARPARAPRGPHVFETSLKPLLSPPLYLPPPPFASLATVWPTLHLAILLLFSSSHSSPILHTRPSPSPCARFLSLERAIARPIRVITHACIRLCSQSNMRSLFQRFWRWLTVISRA